MSLIRKPMKASDYAGADTLTWSEGYYIATPKIDGYRIVVGKNGVLQTSSFSPVPNKYINSVLNFLPEGMDGELTVGTKFEDNGAIRRVKGEPDFTFHVFDYVLGSLETPYETRANDYAVFCFNLTSEQKKFVKPLHTKKVFCEVEIDAYESEMLDAGHEGIMLRLPSGPYKCGRATNREEYLIKVKRFSDAEAEVVEVQEMMNNDNDAEKDAFGRTKRSSSFEGKSGAGTMGALTVCGIGDNNPFEGAIFNVGTGFNAELKQEIWDSRNDVVGQTVQYKYFLHGSKDAPRHPVFMRFREPE